MKTSNIKKNIVIGTAQLGTNYGIANIERNITIEKQINFLNFAYDNGFSSFDTAYAYKNSHKIIGEWVKKSSINPILSTKIPKLSLYKNKTIDIIFNDALKELNVKSLKNLFLHNPQDWNNTTLKKYIEDIIQNNIISRFGLSIYDIKDIPKDDIVKIIQIPGNIFNQEILLSEEINEFISNGGKIQIRSVLIQGLLTMPPLLIPLKTQKTKEGISYFQNIAKELAINKVHLAILCMNYLLPEAEIIIGIDNTIQIKDLLNINKCNVPNSDLIEILKESKLYAGVHWDPRTW